MQPAVGQIAEMSPTDHRHSRYPAVDQPEGEKPRRGTVEFRRSGESGSVENVSGTGILRIDKKTRSCHGTEPSYY